MLSINNYPLNNYSDANQIKLKKGEPQFKASSPATIIGEKSNPRKISKFKMFLYYMGIGGKKVNTANSASSFILNEQMNNQLSRLDNVIRSDSPVQSANVKSERNRLETILMERIDKILQNKKYKNLSDAEKFVIRGDLLIKLRDTELYNIATGNKFNIDINQLEKYISEYSKRLRKGFKQLNKLV